MAETPATVRSPGARLLIAAAFLAVSAAMLAALVERLWWVNALESYPRFLMSSAPPAATELSALRQACGQPLEVAQVERGMALVRCGDFWPSRQLWLMPLKSVSPALGPT